MNVDDSLSDWIILSDDMFDITPQEKITACPLKTSKREIGKKYKYRGKIIIWDGNYMRCILHDRIQANCVQCGGKNVCIHQKRRVNCTICGGGSLCYHERQKSRCKICCGSSICNHGNRKEICRLCKGSQICVHDKIKYDCKLCKPIYKKIDSLNT